MSKRHNSADSAKVNSLPGGLKTRLAIAVTGLAAVVAGVATAGPATAASPRLTLCPPLPAPVCGILGGGGTTLPTGVTTADPSSFVDTGTAQTVTLTDPLATIYSSLDTGATVELIGSGATAAESVSGTAVAVTSTTVTATFDLDSGAAPIGPGSYSIVTTPTTPTTALGTLLGDLGLTSLPLDSAAVTVTAVNPSPLTSVTVKPGASASASVSTTGAPFATGDTVSLTTSSGGAVSGLTASGTTVSADHISTTIKATSAVPLANYNLVVTDTAGDTGSCLNCVTVSDATATKLTMTATHSHLTSGAHLTLSGVLSTTAGNGLSEKSVALYLSNAGTKTLSKLKTVTTSSSGRFSYAFAPKRNAVYVAYFAGTASATAGDLQSLSPVRTVKVARKVTLHTKIAGANSKQGKHPLTATGKVSPAGAGRTVKLYDGARKIGSGKVTKKGTFRIKVKSLKAGKHSLRAKVAAQTAYAAGASKVVHKTVK